MDAWNRIVRSAEQFDHTPEQRRWYLAYSMWWVRSHRHPGWENLPEPGSPELAGLIASDDPLSPGGAQARGRPARYDQEQS